MFESRIYTQRRERLKEQVGSGLVLFLGNQYSPMNYPANPYHFRQDSSFLYFFGLGSSDLAGVIDVDAGRDILFGNDVSVDDIIWMGDQPLLRDRAAQVGVSETRPLDTLSEVIGELTVPVDRWMRTLGMRRVAEQELELLVPEKEAFYQAYADGVNARIAQGRLPVEFTLLRYRPEPWTVLDSIAWVKMMSWVLSVNWETEITRALLIEKLGPEKAAELEPDEIAHVQKMTIFVMSANIAMAQMTLRKGIFSLSLTSRPLIQSGEVNDSQLTQKSACYGRQKGRANVIGHA